VGKTSSGKGVIDTRDHCLLAAPVPTTSFPPQPARPLVVGSFGDDAGLLSFPKEHLAGACDVVEIRLDLLSTKTLELKPWKNFDGIPLLFTARRSSEGGAREWDAAQRENALRQVLDDAWLIDIEVASLGEMAGLVEDMNLRKRPWIASYHDFRGPTDLARLHAGRKAAAAAGAAAFKAALELGWESLRLPELVDFLRSPGLPVSLMGMGPLAPVSRVLFAQFGSVLNYGYLGDTPTAPGQWSARQLTEAIRSVRHQQSL
jgi:3-dehydroquinate dehydratase type I